MSECVCRRSAFWRTYSPPRRRFGRFARSRGARTLCQLFRGRSWTTAPTAGRGRGRARSDHLLLNESCARHDGSALTSMRRPHRSATSHSTSAFQRRSMAVRAHPGGDKRRPRKPRATGRIASFSDGYWRTPRAPEKKASTSMTCKQTAIQRALKSAVLSPRAEQQP